LNWICITLIRMPSVGTLILERLPIYAYLTSGSTFDLLRNRPTWSDNCFGSLNDCISMLTLTTSGSTFDLRRNRPTWSDNCFAEGDSPTAPYKFVLNNLWHNVTTPNRSNFEDFYVGIVHRDHCQKSLNALGQSGRMGHGATAEHCKFISSDISYVV
jgi:hypothetical protein